jgi:Iron-sulfur cluster-binding domain
LATLEITTKIGCNVGCAYCPQNEIQKAYRKVENPVKYMKFETFKKCIDKVPKNISIHFSGLAEPWLNNQCTRMVLYANQKEHRISVFTTLVGMEEHNIDELEKIIFKEFWVHLPSKKNKENIKIDSKYLSMIKKIARSKINVMYRVHDNRIAKEIEEIINSKIQYIKNSTRAGNLKIKYLQNLPVENGIIACKRGLKQNVLLPNGDVILCCMDYGIKHKLGNLIKNDYFSSLLSKNGFLISHSDSY